MQACCRQQSLTTVRKLYQRRGNQEIDQALDLLPASKVHVACCAEMRQCRKRDDALEGKSNLTESSRDTNDETLALEELGDGDLVAGRVLHQLNVRNRIADLNHDGS